MRSLHDLIGDDVRDEEEDTASLDGGLEGSYLSAGRRGNGYVPSSSVDEETETGRKGKSKERRGRLQMRGEVSIPEKYRGEKVSSKELRRSIEARLSGENEGTRGEDEDDEDEDEEDDEEDEDEEEDDAVDSITERTRSLRVSAQEGSEGDEEEEEDDEDDEGFGLDPSLAMEAKRIEEEEAGTLRLYSRKAEQEKSEEAVKGRHCSNQTSLWKKNVHVLVHIQRCLQVANRIPPLPPNDDAQAGRDEKGQSSALSRLCKEADSLVLSLRHLQSALCRQNDEVRKGVENPSRGDLFPAFSFSSSSSPGSVANGEGAGEVRDRKRRWQEAFPSEERRAWEIQVDRRQRRILSFCLKTFDLWKDKTQVARHQGFKALDQSLKAQMTRACTTDFEKLLKRGTASSNEFAGEEGGEGGTAAAASSFVYEDTEFYVRLLQEVAGKGSAGGVRADAHEEVARLGGLSGRSRKRASQEKKKQVERRASKGRKIRFVAVPQLVNFMAPVRRESSMKYEGEPELVDRLVNSLFNNDT